MTPKEKRMHAAKARSRLYQELVSFVTANGAWAISEPGCDPFRFEQLSSSPVADELKSAGHVVTCIGNSERCTGFAGRVVNRDGIKVYDGLVPVNIFEINLGGNLPPIDTKMHKPGAGSRIAIESSGEIE